MFWDDIVLVTEQIEKHGLEGRFVDIGGLEQPCIADYNLTIATSDQEARYVKLQQRPFDHIDKNYLIVNPATGGPYIEDMPHSFADSFDTAVCLNVIEHVQNPFRVFAALFQVMRAGSILIIETVFSFPYHPSPLDYWRYSPDCLRYLSERSGFKVLECDWRLIIPGNRGVWNTRDKEPQEVRSVYVTLTKGNARDRAQRKFVLPRRISSNAAANKILVESQK